MASQSAGLAAETAVMRRFDVAMQAAAGLPLRARGRVLRYAAERTADHLEVVTAEMAHADGQTPGGSREHT